MIEGFLFSYHDNLEKMTLIKLRTRLLLKTWKNLKSWMDCQLTKDFKENESLNIPDGVNC